MIENVIMSETQKVAFWMASHSYATGHGDTVEDMLNELDWQAQERGQRAAAQAGGEQSPTVKQAMRVFEAALKGRRVGNAEGFAAGIEAAAQFVEDRRRGNIDAWPSDIRALRPPAARETTA